MSSNNLRKRIIVFSIFVIGGFACSYFFLRNTHQTIPSTPTTTSDKKDSVIAVSLFRQKIDFENEAVATTEKAASGKHSYKLTPQTEYGYGVNKMMKDIPDYQNLNQIDVELKCWLPNKVDAVFVLSIEDATGKSMLWDSKPITVDKTGDWGTLHFTYTIKPEAIKPDYIIKLYPWNKTKQEFFIDDISVDYKGMQKINSSTILSTSATNFFFNFETTDGLTGIDNIKQTTAHSGKMACDLSSGKEYGPLVIKSASAVSSMPLKKISASVWVFPLTDNPLIVLTASISNAKGESVFWDGKSTNKQFAKNKWTKLNANFVLPFEKISGDDKIQVNVWNKSRTDLIIDDMEVVYGESADRKGEASTIDANTIYEKQFVPQKNKPPFKTIYFTKQEISNYTITNFSPNDEYIVGDFIKDKNNLDEIICIQNGKATMLKYSSEQSQFIPIHEKELSADSLLKNKKTIGDFKENTLFKPTDITFSGDYFGDNNTEILKLNTDWRFDLKLIEQEKEDYTILGTVDFKGYPNDYNPKYYEFTKIIAGNFISSKQTSLLVISCNCADATFNGVHCNQFENNPALPNNVSVYSIENK